MRKEKDVHKLMVSEFNVSIPNENDTSELKVDFYGPKDSPYHGVSPISHSPILMFRVSGKCGSCYLNSIRSKAHLSDSKIESSIRISMKCKYIARIFHSSHDHFL